jgi:hypothetical protein
MTNLKYGWIGLYRSISNHWIYPQNREFTKFEAWIDLLLMVNHQDNKMYDGYDVELCKKGETITSLSKLMFKWKWSKSKLMRFLEVLKKDTMIDFFSDSKKTTIKVCNYTTYQDFRQIAEIKKTAKRPLTDRRETADRPLTDTNNNDNNINNEDNVNKTIKEEIIIDKPISLYSEFNDLYFQFYQNRVGIKPIFNSVDGKSLKSIIKYLTEISNNNDPAAAWKYILDNIDKWDLFYQDQLKLNQIYSNLPNILNNIKNGISKNKPIDKQAERIKQDIATVTRLAEKYEREGIDLN